MGFPPPMLAFVCICQVLMSASYCTVVLRTIFDEIGIHFTILKPGPGTDSDLAPNLSWHDAYNQNKE